MNGENFWGEFPSDEEYIHNISKDQLDNLVRKSRYEIEIREQHQEYEHKYEELEVKLKKKFLKIDTETIQMEEEISDLMKTFQRNQNYEVEVFSYGTFMNEGMKQLCTDIVRLTQNCTSEFEKDDLLYIVDLFSGGSNVAERRIEMMMPSYDELLENTSKKVKSLTRQTLKPRSDDPNLITPKSSHRSIKSLTNEIKSLAKDTAGLGDTKKELEATEKELAEKQELYDDIQEYLRKNNDSPIVINSPHSSPGLSPRSPSARKSGSELDSSTSFHDYLNDIEFTDEHRQILKDMLKEFKDFEKENKELEQKNKEAEVEMEKASAENNEYENRVKRITESMGPLKEKYYLMKNAYISVESLKAMIEEYMSGRLTTNSKNNVLLKNRIQTFQTKLNQLKSQDDDLAKQMQEMQNEIDSIKAEIGEN